MGVPADDDVPSWMREDLPDSNATATNAEGEAPPPAPAAAATDEETGDRAEDAAPAPAASATWSQHFRDAVRRDGRLLLVTLAILVCLNLPYVHWLLYPFTLFSTWIHELCHGLAAVLAGGSVARLLLYPDGSGLAYTRVPAARRGFVISAGYQGTAVVGCLLLVLRRTKRGPRAGTLAVAVAMLLSCVLWIRNAFGFATIFALGLVLAGAGWKLPSAHVRTVYVGLAATCSLNAVASVHNLFGADQRVNGAPSGTDAQSMADLKGGTSAAWAALWLALAAALTVAGILCAVPGPDEAADFACCGLCQDAGLFECCNYPGQRVLGRLRKRWNETGASTGRGRQETL